MNRDAVNDALTTLAGTGRVCTPLRMNQRIGLCALLHGYQPDMKPNDIKLVGERDLCALYDNACISIDRGLPVSQNIARKYQPNPLLDTPAAPVINPVTLKPAPFTVDELAKPAPAADMSQYAKRSYVDQKASDLSTEYRGKVRELQTEANQHQKNLTETLLKFTDALPEVIRAEVVASLKALTPVTLTVVLPNEAPAAIGMVHNKLPQLIKMLAAGGHVYLHGPAGSGKTTAAKQCADAFKLPFYFAAKVESEYMLLGFKDARGETVRTQFREAYEHGGVFLFDELDGSSPSAVVAMNAALANGICPFPDGIINMHADFKCIGGGNTKLSGATREYVGRNQLDAASVDRFDFLEWGYDDALESAIATNANWCAYVQSARKAVADRSLKHLVTPRATYRGCKLLEGGLTWEETETAVLWKGLDDETVSQLKRSMPVKAPKPVEGIL